MTMPEQAKKRRPVAALLALLPLAACAPEPFDRPGTWRASGANEANLRAMIADPAHLSRGAEAAHPARGEAAALAGARLSRPSQGNGDPNGGVPPLPLPAQANVRR